MEFKTPNEEELEAEMTRGSILRHDNANHSRIKFKYTNSANFNDQWNDTVRMCRGIIYDDAFNIKALPLPKFFNINEREETRFIELQKNFIPYKEKIVVTEKLDGVSIVCYYEPELKQFNLTTLGSFSNEFINEAWSIFKEEKLGSKFFKLAKELNVPDDELTLQFELISPVSKIVIDYKDSRRLVLFAATEHDSGGRDQRIFVSNLHFDIFVKCGFDTVNVYVISNIIFLEKYMMKITEEKPKDEEGFVIHILDQVTQKWLRSYKMKYDFYMRRSYLKSHLTTKNLLKKYVDYEDEFEERFMNENLEFMTEEDLLFIDTTIKDFGNNVKAEIGIAKIGLDSFMKCENIRKEIGLAEGFRRLTKNLMFASLDNKDLKSIAESHIIKNLETYNL